jgi:hypothetical protein
MDCRVRCDRDARTTSRPCTRARFLIWNVLELEALNEQFDTVLDCGLFHVLEDDDRPRFVDSLRKAVPSGGHYYRTRSEPTSTMGGESSRSRPPKIDVIYDTDGAHAWLASVTRT